MSTLFLSGLLAGDKVTITVESSDRKMFETTTMMVKELHEAVVVRTKEVEF